jgi:hypothetical protein
MDFCNVQVTKWIDTEVDIKTWNDFLKQKGYETDVRMSKSSDGKTLYCLYRNLTSEEKEGISQGTYKFKNNTIEKVYTKGRRIK